MKAADIYAEVTAALVAEIETGLADPKGWVKPWQGGSIFGHRNATTDKVYLGFNQFALAMSAKARGYEAPVWATFRQWQEFGAQVRKGEKATHLVKWVSKPCKSAHSSNVFCNHCGDGFPVGFSVFNASQVDGFLYVPTSDTSEHERIEAGERMIEAAKMTGVTFRELPGSDAAYYERPYDMVTMPTLSQFLTPEDFYSTALHELAHASGHERRCNRDHLAKRFGDEHYAMEELIAEFAAAFLCRATGISDSQTARHGDYLASWVRVLKNDSKALASAASASQKAADYWLKVSVATVREEVAA